MYSAIVFMYASYVMNGKITIESIPPMLKPLVEEMLAEMTKKPEDGE